MSSSADLFPFSFTQYNGSFISVFKYLHIIICIMCTIFIHSLHGHLRFLVEVFAYINVTLLLLCCLYLTLLFMMLLFLLFCLHIYVLQFFNPHFFSWVFPFGSLSKVMYILYDIIINKLCWLCYRHRTLWMKYFRPSEGKGEFPAEGKSTQQNVHRQCLV